MHKSGRESNNPCMWFSARGLKGIWCWPHQYNFAAVSSSRCHNANATPDADFIKDQWTARIRPVSENENARLRDSPKQQLTYDFA